MSSFEILAPSNSWIILIGFFIAIGYSWLLYSKKHNWNKRINLVLAATRFVLVLFLFILLASPLLKVWQQLIQKPIHAILIDNSTSVVTDEDSTAINAYLNSLEKMRQSLEGANAEVVIKTLDNKFYDNFKDIKFSNPSTNLTQALRQVEDESQGNNLVSITLLSDGIYNQGVAPDFQKFKTPIYAVGVGDTVPKRDISIKNTNYNKTAFVGNKFPISCDIKHNGFNNTQINVSLKENGRVIKSQSLNLSVKGISKVDFEIEAATKGTHHYQIVITPIKGEYTTQNNQSHAYINVVDTKDKILILAGAPHPDIKAIKACLEGNDQLEVQIVIPGITAAEITNNYGVVILVQLPNKLGLCNDLLDKLYKSNSAFLYINGSNTNLAKFNQSENIISINQSGSESDLVFAVSNSAFSYFSLTEQALGSLAKFPPLQVPFGEYSLKNKSQTLFYQRVGSVVTTKPLISLGTDNDRKIAVIAGEGIWQWRLNEIQETGQSLLFDEIVNKTIQYLTSKEDKRKFKVYPLEKELHMTERLVFDNEIYNNIYERTYDNEISLTITSESQKQYKYKYLTNKENSKFDAGIFEPGLYKYSATTMVSGKQEFTDGYFTIKETLLERMNSTADFALLRELTTKNGGQFYQKNQIDKLSEKLLTQRPKAKVLSNEDTIEIINLKWIFFLILILISLEWIIRKYSGGY